MDRIFSAGELKLVETELRWQFQHFVINQGILPCEVGVQLMMPN